MRSPVSGFAGYLAFTEQLLCVGWLLEVIETAPRAGPFLMLFYKLRN